MAKEWPKYEVFVVEDGDAKGLLIKRRLSAQEPQVQWYFYLHGAEGLSPTSEIKLACNQCHRLTESVYEKRLFEQLIDYAKAVYQTGNNRIVVKSVSRKYQNQKGYQDLVDHFFERVKSPLREFFIDTPTFKRCVLSKIRKTTDEIIGRAEQFGVLSPHNITFGDFNYIQPIEQVLRIGTNEKPIWFRKWGPIAADFEDGRIYRREERLVELKQLLLDKPFCVLEGLAATGKTVLVRQLGYELLCRDNLAVYYFNFDWNRDFSEEELVREINRVKGIFILENVHLERRKLQRLYNDIKEDQHRHVLLTVRPLYREALDLEDWPIQKENCEDWQIQKENYIVLEPFEQVDEIIRLYVSRHANLPWSEEVYNNIKSESAESFWLLSYALKGYKRWVGKGKPKDWVEMGVKEDLRELELLNPNFPEILVALSFLYQYEVLTAEVYLTENLRFEIVELNSLVAMGEVTKQDSEDGHVLYGLPHIGLAKAYLEHGLKYVARRKIPRLERFIYDYCICEVPNGLSAAVSAPPIGSLIENGGSVFIGGFFMEEWVLYQLNDEQIIAIITHERSLNAITTVMWRMRCCAESRLGHLIKTGRLLPILAGKIVMCHSLEDAAWCLWQVYGIRKQAAKKLAIHALELLDKVKNPEMNTEFLCKFKKLLIEFKSKKELQTFPWDDWPLGS